MSIRVFPTCALVLLFFGLGCAPQETGQDLGPPADWTGTDTRWWREELDTTGVFRNLETLADMGVTGADPTYVGNAQMAQQARSVEQRFEWSLKQSLIEFYRNQPELVDSLFEQHVTPTLGDAVTTGSLRQQVEEHQRKVYKLLRNHFQEPRTALVLGRDVVVPYPDSLREQGVAGKVRTQVFLNDEGRPQAVMLLDGIHPVLNDLAMRATTQMEWRPAYRMRNGRWIAIPAWARFNINFKAN